MPLKREGLKKLEGRCSLAGLYQLKAETGGVFHALIHLPKTFSRYSFLYSTKTGLPLGVMLGWSQRKRLSAREHISVAVRAVPGFTDCCQARERIIFSRRGNIFSPPECLQCSSIFSISFFSLPVSSPAGAPWMIKLSFPNCSMAYPNACRSGRSSCNKTASGVEREIVDGNNPGCVASGFSVSACINCSYNTRSCALC